jgi:glycosyltransferase involved in cell wall biosynthesis
MNSTNLELGSKAISAPDTGHATVETGLASSKAIRVFMMDLWCYTPYYDRYLCEGLASQNIQVTLGSVCPYQDPQYFAKNGLRNKPGLLDVVARLGISNDPVRRVLMLVESSINMLALLARFSVSKPDIVHVQWIPMVKKLPFEIWFLRIVKQLKIKLVYTVHNVLPHDTGKRFAPVFERIYQKMDALICHTQEAKSRLIGEFAIDPERVRLIPHGPLFHDSARRSVEASRAQLSLPEDATMVLWQGIIEPYKGLDFLLEAWSKIDAPRLNARLFLAGTGESRLLETIKEQVSRLGLQKSVRLDFRFIPDEELSVYYQASDILVFPYREVTTSGALMTAMAFKKAIVATNLPAFQEVLRDGESAVFVNHGDVDGFASALRTLIREPEQRERLARGAGSSGNGDNSWSGIARETRQCYAAVLEEARAESIA